MNNKIYKKRTDIESRNISTVIAATTNFVVILVRSSRISSTIVEKLYAEVEQDKIYGEKERERNSIFYYKDSKKESKYNHEFNDEDQETTKLYYNQNFDFSIFIRNLYF